MKKIYFAALGAILLSGFSFGQVDLEVTLNTPTEGSNQAPGVYELEFDLLNNGPDPIVGGDTVYFGYWIGDDLFGPDGTPNSVGGIIYPEQAPNVEAGETIPWAAITQGIGTISVDVSGETEATDVCAWVAGIGSIVLEGPDPNDPDLQNNFSCFDIDPSLASVSELSLEDAISVEYMSNEVILTSSLDGELDYSVVSISGQQVANGSFSDYTSFSTEDLNAGIYVVNVKSDSESKTIKIAVQK